MVSQFYVKLRTLGLNKPEIIEAVFCLDTTDSISVHHIYDAIAEDTGISRYDLQNVWTIEVLTKLL